jgi:hypothetical protein
VSGVAALATMRGNRDASSKESKEISREFRPYFPDMRYRDIPPEAMKCAALSTVAKLCQNFEVEDLIRCTGLFTILA